MNSNKRSNEKISNDDSSNDIGCESLDKVSRTKLVGEFQNNNTSSQNYVQNNNNDSASTESLDVAYALCNREDQLNIESLDIAYDLCNREDQLNIEHNNEIELVDILNGIDNDIQKNINSNSNNFEDDEDNFEDEEDNFEDEEDNFEDGEDEEDIGVDDYEWYLIEHRKRLKGKLYHGRVDDNVFEIVFNNGESKVINNDLSLILGDDECSKLMRMNLHNCEKIQFLNGMVRCGKNFRIKLMCENVRQNISILLDLIPHIRILNLGDCELTMKENELNIFKKFHNLQELNLSNNNINQCEFLNNITTLKSLNIRDNIISNINALNNCTNLITLDVSGNNISDDIDLSNLTNLNSLNISRNRSNNKLMEHYYGVQLLEFDKLVNLKSLNLSDSNFCQFNNMSINTHVVENTCLYNVLLSNLESIMKMSSLTKLSIDIGVELEEKFNFSNLSNIKTLSFARTKATDINGKLIKNVDLFSSLNNIENIKINSYNTTIHYRHILSISNMINLQKLVICTFMTWKPNHLDGLRNLVNLKTVDIRHVYNHNLLILNYIPNIENLSITSIKSERIDFNFQGDLSKLKKLCISGVIINSLLSSISNSVELTELTLNDAECTLEFANDIPWFPNLKNLYINEFKKHQQYLNHIKSLFYEQVDDNSFINITPYHHKRSDYKCLKITKCNNVTRSNYSILTALLSKLSSSNY